MLKNIQQSGRLRSGRGPAARLTYDIDSDSDSDSVWICGTCDKEFNSERAMRQHCDDTGHDSEADDSDSDDPVWECCRCKKEFYSAHALEQHTEATGHYRRCK